MAKKMEEAAAKNMVGASKDEYEKSKQEVVKLAEEKQNNTEVFTTSSIPITSEDLKNLGGMLNKNNLLDSNMVWIGGYNNHRANYNAAVLNLFSKKKLKFLSLKDNYIYASRISDDQLVTYERFLKDDVQSFEISRKLLSTNINIKLKNGRYNLAITQNRDKISQLKKILK